MKRQIAMVLSAFLILLSFQTPAVAAAPEEEGVNILSGKSYTDNGYTYSYPAANALDGNSGTFWSPPSEGLELTIDLGVSMRISAVEIEGRTDMDQSGAQVNIEIQASNDESFGTYELLGKSGKFGFLETYHLDVTSQKKYRYLRFKKDEYVGISEFRAYEAIASDGDIPEVSYDDVEDESLAHAIGVAGAFGVSLEADESGAFQADKPVTRAEFASLIAQALAIRVSGAACGLADMQEHPLKEDVAAVAGQGIMTGYGDLFRPDEGIKFDHALESVLRALGYGELLKETSAVYCLSFAGRTQLLKNVNTEEDTLSRGNAMFLIRNMFETECFDFFGTDGQAGQYKKTKKLMEKRGFYHKTDIMYINQYYSLLTSREPYGEGRLLIGDDELQTSSDSFTDHIGHLVEYYYKLDQNGNKLLYYLYASDKQKEIAFYNEDIVGCFDNKIEYWDAQNQKKSLSLSSNAIVLYNGRLLSGGSVDERLFSEKTGFVSAVDTDGNGGFDVIKIFNGADRYINRAIMDEAGVSWSPEGAEMIVIDPENDTAVIHNAGTLSSDISAVTGDSVITVGRSLDGRHYEVYCGTKTLEEVQITTNSKEEFVVDYETSYRKSSGFINESEIKLRQRGNVYFNYREQAAYYRPSDRYYKNAVVAGVSCSGAFSDQVQVKLFTSSGSVLVYSVDDRVVIDGKRYTDLKSAYQRLTEVFYIGGELHEEPIRYKASMDLVIKEIDTLQTDTGNEQDTFSQLTSGLFYWMYGMIDTSVYTGENTLVIFKYGDETEIKDRYILGSRGELADAHNYNFITYGSNALGRIEAVDMIVINANLTESLAEDTSILAVESVGEGLSESGEPVKILNGMLGGNSVQIPQKNSESLADVIPYLSCGDLVRIALDAKGCAVAGQLIFDYEGEAPVETMYPQYYINKTTFPVRNGFMAPIYWSYGTVYDIDAKQDIMEVRCPKEGENLSGQDTAYYLAKPSHFSWVYYCDIENRTVQAGRWQQLKSYLEYGEGASKIVVRSYSGVHREMIIYSK